MPEVRQILQQMSAPFLEQATKSNILDRQQSHLKKRSHGGMYGAQLTGYSKYVDSNQSKAFSKRLLRASSVLVDRNSSLVYFGRCSVVFGAGPFCSRFSDEAV